MAEKWAEKCAKLEKGASGFIFEAAQIYAQKYAEGWTYQAIADEVVSAGGSVTRFTVSRRIEALDGLEGSSTRSEEAFVEAYEAVNNRVRTNQIPSNTEGRVSMLEKLTDALDKDGWTPGDIAGVVHQRLRPEKGKAEKYEAPAPLTPAKADKEHAGNALYELRQVSQEPGKGVSVILEQIMLEAEVRLDSIEARV